MTLITTTEALGALCARLAGEAYVTVDTEFMRDRTYWAKLCLVQLGGAEEAAAVDPLAPGLDLTPLLDLMAAPNVLKVFHAARQDVEIFVRLAGAAPTPLFDTQIAAMVCGHGEEVGYETLVTRLAHARVDKTSRFTDWGQRPLSEAQIRYALGDVTHLRVVYEALAAELERAGRASWVEQEMTALADPALYDLTPGDAWRRLKVRSRDPRFLAIVREIAAWREREAQRRDLPRNRIVRDDVLLELAASRPKTAEDVARLGRVHLDPRSAQAVVAAVQAGLAVPKEDCPELPDGRRPPRGTGGIVDLLRVLLKLKADANDVAPRLIATTDDLEAVALDDAANVPALAGWRREVFGADALALKRGEIGLVVREGRVQLLPTDAA